MCDVQIASIPNENVLQQARDDKEPHTTISTKYSNANAAFLSITKRSHTKDTHECKGILQTRSEIIS